MRITTKKGKTHLVWLWSGVLNQLHLLEEPSEINHKVSQNRHLGQREDHGFVRDGRDARQRVGAIDIHGAAPAHTRFQDVPPEKKN